MKTTMLIIIATIAFGLMSCEKQELSDPITSSFTDPRDDHVYTSVQIGSQIWMAQDLAYLPNVNSPQEGSVDEPFYYVLGYQGNDISEAKESWGFRSFGVLYNWEAAIISCPDGWHLATDEEWITLEQYLGMEWSEGDSDDLRETGNVGQKLKAKNHWDYRADNSSGFSALPGGSRDYNPTISLGYFDDFQKNATFWTSSLCDNQNPWIRGINALPDEGFHAWLEEYIQRQNDGVGRWCRASKDRGYSVRCIKDV